MISQPPLYQPGRSRKRRKMRPLTRILFLSAALLLLGSLSVLTLFYAHRKEASHYYEQLEAEAFGRSAAEAFRDPEAGTEAGAPAQSSSGLSSVGAAGKPEAEGDPGAALPARTPSHTPSQANEDRIPDEDSGGADGSEAEPLPSPDWDYLRGINGEIAGWLYIPGAISFPVVYTQEHPYSYYESHLFSGAYAASGCVFLDKRITAISEAGNCIIYGHHMADGSIFGVFAQDPVGFVREHPVAYFLTPQQDYIVTLFSANILPVSSDYIVTEFGENGPGSWLSYVLHENLLPDVSADEIQSERFVSLSTCSGGHTQRLFLIGSLTPLGDAEG